MTTDLTENDMNTNDPLSLITSGPRQEPPRIVLYGVQGIGKTAWPSEAPAPIYIPVEAGLGRLTVPAFPQPTTFEEVEGYIDALRTGDHSYGTLVIDTLDALEVLIFAFIARVMHKTSIDDFDFYAGRKLHTPAVWRKLLASLENLRMERGMAIVLIAHSTETKIEPADGASYDSWTLRLEKWSNPVVEDWADAVFFAKYQETIITEGKGTNKRGRGIGDGSRVLYTERRPAWTAKNRWGLPDQLPYPKGQGWATFMAAYAEAMSETEEPNQPEPELENSNA